VTKGDTVLRSDHAVTGVYHNLNIKSHCWFSHSLLAICLGEADGSGHEEFHTDQGQFFWDKENVTVTRHSFFDKKKTTPEYKSPG